MRILFICLCLLLFVSCENNKDSELTKLKAENKKLKVRKEIEHEAQLKQEHKQGVRWNAIKSMESL